VLSAFEVNKGHRHQQHPHVRRPPLSSYTLYRGQPGQLQPCISGFNSLELIEQNTPPTRLFLMNVRQLLQMHFALVSAFNGTFMFGITSITFFSCTLIAAALRFFGFTQRKLSTGEISLALKNGMALYVIKLYVQPVSLERPSTSGPLIAFYDAAKS